MSHDWLPICPIPFASHGSGHLKLSNELPTLKMHFLNVLQRFAGDGFRMSVA